MTTLTTILVITLCISNICLIAALGYLSVTQIPLKQKSHRETPLDDSQQPAPLSSKEDEQMRAEARRKFEAEMDAFQQMMGYNADMAYGIQPKPTDEE